VDTSGLTAVRRRIADAATRAGRTPAEVRLVVVSKGRTVGDIAALHAAGHEEFGENRPDELAQKAARLPSDIAWHFVGSLQTRRVSVVRPVTSILHSLDRAKLVDAWAREPRPPAALLQVNIAGEQQKHGAEPSSVPALVERSIERGIDVVGLMVIPPRPEAPEDSRRWFAETRTMRDELAVSFPSVRHLSMGMTDDFEVAVEEGATIVRVGRAIFGPAAAG
jgi:PLP dependent protein